MSTTWWTHFGLFALAMIAVSFINTQVAIIITLFVALAAVVVRLERRKVA